jgi:hypothetical protein
VPEAELWEELYEDLWLRLQATEETLRTTVGNEAREPIIEERAELARMLGVELEEASESGDPLIDHWEAQIARGEEPDLDMTLEDLRCLNENASTTR